MVVVSSQSVDSQLTTDDDQVCDREHLSELKEDVNELKRGTQRILDNQQSGEMTRDMRRMLQLLDNQQQLLQTMTSRFGMS